MVHQTTDQYLKEVLEKKYDEFRLDRRFYRMGQEKICPVCKEHLDPEEKCTCWRIKKNRDAIASFLLGGTTVMNILTTDNILFEKAVIRYLKDDCVEVFIQDGTDRVLSIDYEKIQEISQEDI